MDFVGATVTGDTVRTPSLIHRYNSRDGPRVRGCRPFVRLSWNECPDSNITWSHSGKGLPLDSMADETLPKRRVTVGNLGIIKILEALRFYFPYHSPFVQ